MKYMLEGELDEKKFSTEISCMQPITDRKENRWNSKMWSATSTSGYKIEEEEKSLEKFHKVE